MIARAYGDRVLFFDRDAILRAALRSYVETILADVCLPERYRVWTSCYVDWRGDVQTGAFFSNDGEGNDHTVGWTKTGVVGLAYELGWGPLQQLGLSISAVTRGPDDVRGAVPGLPPDLEPAFLFAADMVHNGDPYGEKRAGVGFWFDGDRVEGSMFDDPTPEGADRLSNWGALRNGRLRSLCGPEHDAMADEWERTITAPFHAIIDAVTTRALQGPTELTPEELATLLPTPPDPKRLLGIQRSLQKAGITWPGSPELPPLPPPGPNPFIREDPTPKP